MSRRVSELAFMLLMLAGASTSLSAASLDQSLSDADSRRRAAENGLREIKAKSPAQADQVQALYGEAAAKNNAWVDAVCGAIEQGASSAPDVAAIAEPAASSLVEWVGGRNKALGLPDLTVANADAVRKQIRQNLLDIADGAWRSARNRDPEKRKKTATDLRERLRWKAFAEIQ